MYLNLRGIREETESEPATTAGEAHWPEGCSDSKLPGASRVTNATLSIGWDRNAGGEVREESSTV